MTQIALTAVMFERDWYLLKGESFVQDAAAMERVPSRFAGSPTSGGTAERAVGNAA